MGQLYIRLNNNFVLRKGRKYFVTNIKKPKEWSKLTMEQKEQAMGKDVTSKIKRLLKKHGSKSNMNFKTTPSKRKIRTNRKRGGGKCHKSPQMGG